MWLLAATCALGCKTHESRLQPLGDAPELACPTYLDLEFSAKESRFDPGWSGRTHGVGLTDESRLSVKIDECRDECRRCKFHGPVRGDPAKTPVITQRCLKKVSRICATDDDCGPGNVDGPCRFMFPPITSTESGTCTIAYFEPQRGPGDPSPVQGSIDLATGEADMPVLNIQLSVSVGACEDCLGDRVHSDAIAGGTCSVSKAACDVNGPGATTTSATSFDCAPPAGVSTIVLGTSGTSTSSVVWKMDPDRPKCTSMLAMGKACWCGVCSDNGLPCTRNTDCPVGSTCGAAQGPPPGKFPWVAANNSCPDKCNYNTTTQRGTCVTTDSNNGLPCFPDTGTITATGGAAVNKEFLTSRLANLICMPSFNNGELIPAFVDVVGGFPGPFLFEAQFRVEKRFGP
ncbi:MAG TPA: hypothetical protein VFD36_22745 [Kofleriaceae bacterium]|nr:hypothetical protein [Kofleriaceae bacterium]